MLKPIPLEDQSRAPPHSYEAEQMLLGAALLDNRAADKARQFLLPEHFAEPLYGRMYAAMILLLDQGRKATAITLLAAMDGDPDLERAGDEWSKAYPDAAKKSKSGDGRHGFMASLVGGAPMASAAADYARLIFDMHLRRELVDLGHQIMEEAFNPEGRAAEEMIGITQDFVERVATSLGTLKGQNTGGLVPATVYLDEAIALAEQTAQLAEGETAGLSTGIHELDKRMGGMLPGDYILFAGRPSMGKSSLLDTILYNVGRALHKKEQRPHRALLFTPEMSRSQHGARILGYETEITQMQQRAGPIGAGDIETLIVARRRLEKMGLFIDDSPIRSVGQLVSRCARFLRNQPIDLIALDYVQLITGTESEKVNRAEVVARISRELKALAKDIGCPIIVVSQLNRAVESRDNKRPLMSDLRESGGLEQDPDIIGLLYRESYYLERTELTQGARESDEDFNKRTVTRDKRIEDTRLTADIDFVKTRHGPTGRCSLFFNPPRQWFGTLDLKYSHADNGGPRAAADGDEVLDRRFKD